MEPPGGGVERSCCPQRQWLWLCCFAETLLLSFLFLLAACGYWTSCGFSAACPHPLFSDPCHWSIKQCTARSCSLELKRCALKSQLLWSKFKFPFCIHFDLTGKYRVTDWFLILVNNLFGHLGGVQTFNQHSLMCILHSNANLLFILRFTELWVNYKKPNLEKSRKTRKLKRQGKTVKWQPVRF